MKGELVFARSRHVGVVSALVLYVALASGLCSCVTCVAAPDSALDRDCCSPSSSAAETIVSSTCCCDDGTEWADPVSLSDPPAEPDFVVLAWLETADGGDVTERQFGTVSTDSALPPILTAQSRLPDLRAPPV